MKRTILILLTVTVTAFSLTAQEETLNRSRRLNKDQDGEMRTLFGNHRANGGYGAFWMGYSVIDNRNAIHFGGRGSWVFQHNFALGFGGTGFINEYHYDISLNQDVFLTGGYGGLYLEPIILPRSPVHLSFPVLLGAGGVSFVSYNDANWGSNFVEDYSAFLIVEPAAEIELNITRFMRIGLGTSYRFPFPFRVNSGTATSADPESLKGFAYNISFKFGSF